jgi:hypothetical protein
MLGVLIRIFVNLYIVFPILFHISKYPAIGKGIKPIARYLMKGSAFFMMHSVCHYFALRFKIAVPAPMYKALLGIESGFDPLHCGISP